MLVFTVHADQGEFAVTLSFHLPVLRGEQADEGAVPEQMRHRQALRVEVDRHVPCQGYAFRGFLPPSLNLEIGQVAFGAVADVADLFSDPGNIIRTYGFFVLRDPDIPDTAVFTREPQIREAGIVRQRQNGLQSPFPVYHPDQDMVFNPDSLNIILSGSRAGLQSLY